MPTGVTMRRLRALMLAVQACFVLFALALVFWPSTRTTATMLAASTLAFAVGLGVIWRMHSAGATGLSMAALWTNLRRNPWGAGVGVSYFDMLAIWMSFVLPFLAY